EIERYMERKGQRICAAQNGDIHLDPPLPAGAATRSRPILQVMSLITREISFPRRVHFRLVYTVPSS
ncbi:hypothetical protein J6590_095567, partial [Homalodisca vitripennis]